MTLVAGDFQLEQFRDIYHLIPQALDARDGQCPQIEDPDKWKIYVKYCKILSQILIDQNDSNSSSNCWAIGRQERYFRLAFQLLDFLKFW